jgi:hypothetical protein
VLSYVGLVAAGLTLAFRGELTGPAGIRGNMHGTALVVAVAARGLWLLSVVRFDPSPRCEAVRVRRWSPTCSTRGSCSAWPRPYNRFFLVYVAFMGAGMWTATEVVGRLHDRPSCSTLSSRTRHVVAGAVPALALLNAVAWLARIVPSVVAAGPGLPALADASMTPVLTVAAAVVLVSALVLIRSSHPGRSPAQSPSITAQERRTR